MSTLIVSAVKYEVKPLLEKADAAGINLDYIETKIGAINAAKSVEQLERAAKGKDVIYVGTCGVFGEFKKPKLVRAKKVVWLPACERASIAWSIEGVDKPVTIPSPPAWAKGLEETTVICGSTISKSEEISDDVYKSLELKKEETLVENLELYSCAEALLKSANSFVAILGVTNAIGLAGRVQWKSNFKEAASMTSEYVFNNLK